MPKVWWLAIVVLVLNLPFGYWRAGVPKLSRSWFVAIHAPIPFVIILRVTSGLGWQLASFPIIVGAFLLGQFLGGKGRQWRTGGGGVQ